MAKYTVLKNNLSAGELSKKLRARIDSKEYANGAELVENFIPLANGGASFRPGLEHYAAPAAPFAGGVLIPFIVANDVTYLVHINFHGTPPENGSLTDDPVVVVYDINAGTTINVAWATTSYGRSTFDPRHDMSGIRYQQKHDVMFITHVDSDMHPFVLVRLAEDSFWCEKFVNYNKPSVTAGDYTDEILRRPYTPSNTDGEKLLNPSATTGSITLTAENSSATPINFFTARHIYHRYRINHAGTEGECWVFDVPNLRQAIAGLGTRLGNSVFTIIGHGYNTGDKIYFSIPAVGAGVGDHPPAPIVTLDYSAKPYYVIDDTADTFGVAETYDDAIAGNFIVITGTISGTMYAYDGESETTACSAYVEQTFGGATASDNWKESMWSNYYGWPKHSAIYQRRLMLAGCRAFPDWFWFSLTDNFFHFMAQRFAQDSATDTSGLNYYGAVADSDPFNYPLDEDAANSIQWLRTKATVQIGTLGAEHIMSSVGGAIKYDDINSRIQTETGGSDVDAVGINNVTLFVSRNGKVVREFVYNEANGSYITSDLSLLSSEIINHLFDDAAASAFNTLHIKQMVYHPSRDCVFLVTSIGALVGCVYNRETSTLAWFKCTLGGTDAYVHSVASVPSLEGKSEVLYVLVSRTINSATYYSIEKLGEDFNHSDLLATADGDKLMYFDAGGITTLGSTTDTVSGLSRLEGETLGVLVDGLIHDDCEVTSGAITLDQSYASGTIVTYGLKYNGNIKLFPVEAGGEFGVALGLVKRIDRVMLTLFKTLGLKIGRDADNLEDCDEITGHPFTSGTLTPFSGDIIKYFAGDNETDSTIYLRQDRAYPCTITGIFLRGVTYD